MLTLGRAPFQARLVLTFGQDSGLFICVLLLLFYWLFGFSDKFFLCIPGWPWVLEVPEGSLKLKSSVLAF
jgi:hypothetical protein